MKSDWKTAAMESSLEDRVILLANLGDSVEESDVAATSPETKDEVEDTNDPPAIVYLAASVAAIGGLLFGEL